MDEPVVFQPEDVPEPCSSMQASISGRKNLVHNIKSVELTHIPGISSLMPPSSMLFNYSELLQNLS